jgi:hypothetical protein
VVSDDEIESVARLGMGADGERVEHGEHVIAHTPDVQSFIRRWRDHFLRTMRPEFLPAHWDVDRPATRPGVDTPGY